MTPNGIRPATRPPTRQEIWFKMKTAERIADAMLKRLMRWQALQPLTVMLPLDTSPAHPARMEPPEIVRLREMITAHRRLARRLRRQLERMDEAQQKGDSLAYLMLAMRR